MKKKTIILTLIFFLAFFIRLIALNQSLWLDEATTTRVVQQYNYQQILTVFSPHDFHPPLYYFFMKLWTGFFGYSEVAMRVPSVIFSLATGWVVYLIGGIWATAFFLFNPMIIYYSQEARMYMAVTMFLTAAIYYLLKCLSVKNFKNLVLFNIFLILSFYTFYGSIFLIAAFFIYFLYKKKYQEFFVSCFAFLVSLIIISPLLYQQLINAKISLSSVANWSLVLGKANLKNLLLIPIKFSIGRIDFYPKWFYYLVAGLWTVFVLYQILNIKKQKDKLKFKNIYLFYYLLISPLFLGFIVSFVTPLLQYFRFIFLIPIMSILLAKKNATVYCYTVVIGFTIFSLVYLLNPAFYREDWKSLVKSLPKDKSVYMITASSDALKYYDNSLKVNELTYLRPAQRDFGGQSDLEKNIIIIPYTADIYGFDYKSILYKDKYKLVKEKAFRGIMVETYSL